MSVNTRNTPADARQGRSRQRRPHAIYRVGPRSQSGGRRIERMSIYVGLAKDVLDVFWKAAPFALVLPGAMLLLFLKRCNWSELFVESAISVPGLTYILITGLLAAATLMTTFVLPSVITIGINYGNVKQEFLSKTVIPIYFAAYVGWCLALIGSVFFNLIPDTIWLFAPGCAVGMSIFLMSRGHSVPYAETTKRWGYVLRAGEATFAVMMNAFGILVLMQLVPPGDGVDHVRDALYVGGWALISIVGIGPGLLYLRLRATKHGYIAPLKVALTGATFAGLIALYGICGFVPVSLRLLSAAGIFSDERGSFQIVDKSVAPALKLAGFAITSMPDGELVSGYARYNLNSVRLLCNRPLEPKRTSLSLLGASDAEQRKARLLAGSNCVKTGTAELRRITPAAPLSVPAR